MCDDGMTAAVFCFMTFFAEVLEGRLEGVFYD